MSENFLPTALPTRQATAIEGRSRRGAVTGKLRAALDLMVWSGEKRADAAEMSILVTGGSQGAHVLNERVAEAVETLAPRLGARLRVVHQTGPKDVEGIARRYERLAGSGVTVPEIPEGGRHVFYCYVVRVPGGKRDALRQFLSERGIGTGVHYPVPIHLQEASAFLGYRQGDFPVTERLAAEVLPLLHGT